MKLIKFFLFFLIFNNCSIEIQCDDFCDSQIPHENGPKYCRFRNLVPHPENLWVQLTCAQCYLYCQEAWFKEKLQVGCNKTNTNYYICATTVDGNEIDFDYRNKKNLNLIKNSFLNDAYFNKHVDCCKAAEDCCTNTMTNQNICPSKEYPCPTVWDAWQCFPAAKADTTNKIICPTYVTSSQENECAMFASKVCDSNGKWIDKSNYSSCAAAPIYRRRHNVHLDILYASTALMIPSVIIFLILPKLRILRVMLHLNLIVTIIVKNIFSILSENLVFLDSLKPLTETNDILVDSGIPCKVLAVFESIFKNAIFTSMFIDGFYLHKMLVRLFASDPNIYVLIFILVVFSTLPSLIWMSLMWANDKGNCWMVDYDSWYTWITDGYKYMILAINTILFADIIRVLIFKLKRNKSNAKTMSTFKAAIFLLPLFGVPLLITSKKEIFDPNDCEMTDIYYYVTYAFEGLQGVLVATIFCYINSEVLTELKNLFRKLYIQIQERICYKKNPGEKNRRRTTALTNVRSSIVANH